MIISPLLLTDYYKQSHANMYAPGTETVYSTWTQRDSRLEGINKVVCFGLQGFIKEFLINYFNAYFFNLPEESAIAGYERLLKYTVGEDERNIARAVELHRLGYLPLEIRAVKEGSVVPIRTPMIAFWNTDPRFYWLTNYLETLFSCEIWQPATAATIAREYRILLDEWCEKTGGDPAAVQWQGHDFSFRGMTSWQSAAKSGAGHILSFSGSDTIPAISYLEEYYDANIESETVASSIPASEHSVAESYGDMNEREYFRHILGEVYPNGLCSIVSDTWDFWKVVTETIPSLKELILSRDGRLVVRPDSGDPVKIVCGDPESGVECIRKGAIECLWDTFGGTVTGKGFRQLDLHIGLIYGDAITLSRCKAICEQLAAKGFASTNLVFGIGSYTYQYNTRDTFGGAVKSTMAVVNGKESAIFKNPKTDNGVKRSQKGCSVVFPDGSFRDGFTLAEACNHPDNQLEPVFRNGKLLRNQILGEIRSILLKKNKGDDK